MTRTNVGAAHQAATAIPSGSLWLSGRERQRFEPLPGPDAFDAVVLGAGITGLCSALALQRDGLAVAIVEQRWIGAGATGFTTAKLSSLQGTRYSRINSRGGGDAARSHATANEQGLAEIRRLVSELGIECDLRERSNYVYADSQDEVAMLEAELEAARAAGLAVEWVEEVPLPFETAGGIRLSRQAEFHPVKFLDGLADAFSEAGGRIFEQTRATGLKGSDPVRVETDRGELTAPVVVLATHFPFTDRALLFVRMHPERSYSIAVRINGEPPPGMFINASSPTRSIRAHPTGDGELLLVGGESHKTGKQMPTGPKYEALREFATRHFQVDSVQCGWSTQDNMTLDSLPYIGRLMPGLPGVYVATGYAKWGLALAPSAARIIADAVAGRDNPLAESFDPVRLPPLRSLPEIAKEGSDFTLNFARSAISSEPRCTHMGCALNWNDAEESWDCPCHGSRFAADGALLQGPAVDDLPADSLPAPVGGS